MISIDFAEPFPKTKGGFQIILVAVESLTNWPTARATETAAANEVVKFIKEEIRLPFGPPKTVASDNALCFTAAVFQDPMHTLRSRWHRFI